MATHITIYFVAAPAIIQGSRGGSLTCATCHIYVDTAWADKLPAPSADELSMLEMTAEPRQPTSRLSCQVVATAAMDGMVIGLPQTQY
jgi:ferredoxin, 2Fe-2S